MKISKKSLFKGTVIHAITVETLYFIAQLNTAHRTFATACLLLL